MKFMLTYTIDPEQRDAAIKRFRKTGGVAPAGVTMLGRWHRAGSNQGWVLVETTSAKALADFTFGWSDLIALEAHPVIEDAEISQVFESLGF